MNRPEPEEIVTFSDVGSYTFRAMVLKLWQASCLRLPAPIYFANMGANPRCCTAERWTMS